MLDVLRGSFIYVLAVLLPLPGLILAVVRFAQRDTREALTLAAAAVAGACLYLLLLS